MGSTPPRRKAHGSYTAPCIAFSLLAPIGAWMGRCGLGQCVLFVCGVAPSELKRRRSHPCVYGLISGGNFLYPEGVSSSCLEGEGKSPCQREVLPSLEGWSRAVFRCVSIVVLEVYLGGFLYLSCQNGGRSARMSYFCRANAACG